MVSNAVALIARIRSDLDTLEAMMAGEQHKPQQAANPIEMRATALRITIPPDRMLSERAAADFAGVDISTLRRWRMDGRLSGFIKRGGRYLWPVDALAHFCALLPTPVSAADQRSSAKPQGSSE